MFMWTYRPYIKMMKFTVSKVISLVQTSYIDMLDCIDDDGNVISGEHIRMRGVPASCIK